VELLSPCLVIQSVMRTGALLLLVCVSAVSVVGITFANCDCTRGAVLECIQFLFDADHDGIITPVEVAVALQTKLSFVPDYLTWQFIMRCDLDEDGVLTMDDWTMMPPNITCLPTQNCVTIACSVCVQNGFVQTNRPPPPTLPPGAREAPKSIHRVPHPEQADALRKKYARELQEQAAAAAAAVAATKKPVP